MSEAQTTARTQEEIVARIVESDSDMFGFAREVLVAALDYEHAKEYLKPEVTQAEWVADSGPGQDLAGPARDYYGFALGKIRDHRGISASRSVVKLREYAWLLGRDDIVAAMDAADYAQYGAPQVKAFGEGLGLAWPTTEDMVRMAQGLPCETNCYSGCGS